MRRAAWFVWACLYVAYGPSLAIATPAHTGTPPKISATEQLADQLRDQTVPFIEQSQSVGVRVVPASAPHAGDLLQLLVGRLQAARVAARPAVDDATTDRVLEIELVGDHGALAATARLYGSVSSLWPIPPRLEHLYYDKVSDIGEAAVAQSSSGPLALRQRVIPVDVAAALEDTRAVAVTSTHARSIQLIAVGREVAAFSVSDRGVTARWRSALGGASAALWPRTPSAEIAVDENSALVTSSEHRTATRYRLSDGHVLDDMVANSSRCGWSADVGYYNPTGCGNADWPTGFYALRERAMPVDGHVVHAAIAVERDGDELWLLDAASGSHAVRAAGVGGQLALANIGGALVAAHTLPVARGRDDELIVRGLDGTIRYRSGALPGSVRAIAAADSDGDGSDELWALVCRTGCALYQWRAE